MIRSFVGNTDTTELTALASNYAMKFGSLLGKIGRFLNLLALIKQNLL